MGPKKPTQPEEPGGLTERLRDLEAYVSDYILEGKTDDVFLNQYILLVKQEEKSGESLFSGGLLDRPVFWERYLRPWIKDGFQAMDKISV